VNTDIVAQAEEISKNFKIYTSSIDIINEWATLGKRSFHRDYEALKGVSFKIHKGEFVGVIGQNGAGKSTLLKIITGVLQPTRGVYKVNGRVLSILELSGGTDDDLTGRQNVIRSGQLLGLPGGYVQERMAAIEEFSELDDFFDQPLRTYSTGMRSRLSFSMFAFLDTDLLILDEVLAVGDIFFKQKCFARLAELIENKTSIILVTHSLGIIQRYCNRVILLEKGEKIYDGDPGEAIRLFMQIRGQQKAKAIEALGIQDEDYTIGSIDNNKPPRKNSPKNVNLSSWPNDTLFNITSFPKLRGRGRVNLTRMAVLNEKGKPTLTFNHGEQMNIYCEFQVKNDIAVPVFNIEIRDSLNLLIHSKSSIQNGVETPSSLSKGSFVHYYQSITLNIAPESYIVNITCFILPLNDYKQAKELGYQEIVNRMNLLWKLDQAFAFLILNRSGTERLDIVHGGLCDLPGSGQIQVSDNEYV